MKPAEHSKPPQRAIPGFCEWLRIGEYERAERIVEDLAQLGVVHLRTGFSWADYLRPGGAQWFDWLIPMLARHVEVLPCFTYTPPSLGREPHTASPPRRTQDYADFLDHVLGRLGKHFPYVELWNEPNNLNDWDYLTDPGWELFADMMGKAVYWCRQLGHKTVLGGLAPTDPSWLRIMHERGVLQLFDVLGLHGFPGTWDASGKGWQPALCGVREFVEHSGLHTDLWVTEGGYSTWRHDEQQQLERLLEILSLPVERAYLYQLHDLHPDEPHQAGLREDVKHYHFGLKRADGGEKLAYRLWAERGIDALFGLSRALCPAPAAPRPAGRRARPVLVIGGAGFVGSNLVEHLCASGQPVRVLDNLSRPKVENNLLELCATYPELLEVDARDIRDLVAVKQCLNGVKSVYHVGAQVAVTTSLESPAEDFSVNLQGTFNVLETLRLDHPVPLLFTSTNKVYGGIEGLELQRDGDRYQPVEARHACVDERQPLRLSSPYGCSKGAADAYVLDYARSYGLPTVVFRMSCIYGPRQWGTEDQGWVAHFLRQARAGEAVTLFGDGAQVRDILYVGDLVEAMTLALKRIECTAGEAYNIGGGLPFSVSLREVLSLMRDHLGLDLDVHYGPWRQSDQRYYVSDLSKIEGAIGWRPKTAPSLGLRHLHNWLQAQEGEALSEASQRSDAHAQAVGVPAQANARGKERG